LAAEAVCHRDRKTRAFNLTKR